MLLGWVGAFTSVLRLPVLPFLQFIHCILPVSSDPALRTHPPSIMLRPFPVAIEVLWPTSRRLMSYAVPAQGAAAPLLLERLMHLIQPG